MKSELRGRRRLRPTAEILETVFFSRMGHLTRACSGRPGSPRASRCKPRAWAKSSSATLAGMLAGRTQLDAKPPVEFGPYHTLILGGISLSGFFIDTFLAEGFNADPSDGGVVFQGAIAVDGTGNWIAHQRTGGRGGRKEFPYVVPDAKPLRASQILGGHVSDPFYIDIANYTDFYRLRASLTDVDTKNPRMRRYDWPSAHAPAPIDQSGGSVARQPVQRRRGGGPKSHSARRLSARGDTGTRA